MKQSHDEQVIEYLLEWCSLSLAVLRRMVIDSRDGMPASETGTKGLFTWKRKELLVYLIEAYPDWDSS